MPLGNEVLPNVYINNIEIYDKKINFSVMTVDSIENPVWSNKKFLLDKIKLKICCVIDDPQRVTNITSGFVRINKYDEGVKSFFLTELPAKDILERNSYFENHRVYMKKYSVPLKDNIQNLTVFANLFVDEVNVDGPIASESIITSGEVVNSSTLLTKNGQQYYGAVHLHEDQYMESAYHLQSPHSYLQEAQVPNFKLKDLRVKKFKNKKYQDNKPIPEFSDLFVSFDEETNHNYMFFINAKQILVKNTKFGGIIQNLDPVSFSTILSRFAYRVFNISRNKIKTYNKLTIGTRTEKGLSKIIETDNVIMATQADDNFTVNKGKKLEIISHQLGENIHGFYFEDNLNDHSPGEYQYVLEYIFRDPTISVVNSYIASLKSIIENAEFYKDILMRTGSYNHFLRNPTPSFEGRADNSLGFARGAAELSNRFKRRLYDMTVKEAEQDLVRSYSFLNPKSCTVESVAFFIQEIKLLLNKYMSVFDIEAGVIKSNYDKPSSPSSKYAPNTIVIEHRFKKVVTPMNSKEHYVYDIEDPAPTPPKTFGKRGMNLPFKPKVKNGKLNAMLNKSINKSKSLFIKPFMNIPFNIKEKYIESTEYLGKNSNFNSYETKEKCETPNESPEVVTEIQLLATTNVANVQEEIQKVAINKMFLLSGFEHTVDGIAQVKKPIWKEHSGDMPRRTSIIKQTPIENRPENVDFPFANEYILLNNSNTMGKYNTREQAIPRNAGSIAASNYSPMLTMSNIVTNPPLTSVPQQPVDQGTATPSTSTSGMPTTSINTMPTTGGGY